MRQIQVRCQRSAGGADHIRADRLQRFSATRCVMRSRAIGSKTCSRSECWLSRRSRSAFAETCRASALKQYWRSPETRPAEALLWLLSLGSGGPLPSAGAVQHGSRHRHHCTCRTKGQPPALPGPRGGQIDAAVASLGNVNRLPGKIKGLLPLPAPRAFLRIPTCRLRRTRLSGGQHARAGPAFVPAETPPGRWWTSWPRR